MKYWRSEFIEIHSLKCFKNAKAIKLQSIQATSLQLSTPMYVRKEEIIVFYHQISLSVTGTNNDKRISNN